MIKCQVKLQQISTCVDHIEAEMVAREAYGKAHTIYLSFLKQKCRLSC